MSRRTRRRLGSLAVVGLLLLPLACSSEDDDPPPAPDTTDAAQPAPECADVGEPDAAVRLVPPPDFTVGDDPSLDRVFVGAAESGLVPRVGLIAFDQENEEDDDDQELLLSALTFVTGGNIGDPASRQAREQVLADRLRTITYTGAIAGGEDSYTVHAQLENVGDERFAVVVLAPEQEYAALEAAVLPTVTQGPCP